MPKFKTIFSMMMMKAIMVNGLINETIAASRKPAMGDTT